MRPFLTVVAVAALLPALVGAAEAPAAADDTLTLAEALHRVALHNPALQAAGHEHGALVAAADQAARGVNPELELSLENFAGSGDAAGFGGGEATIALSQVLELGGKRARRGEAARSAADVAALALEDERLAAAGETAEAFIAVLTAQQAVVLARDAVRTAVDDSAAVQRRVSAGAASPVDAARARIATATARLDVRLARGELAQARERLAVLWGGRGDEVGNAAGDLDGIAPPPAVEDLESRLADAPASRRWDAVRAAAAAEAALARAMGRADLTASLGYRRLGLDGDGDNALVVGLGLPLTVRDDNSGAVAAARAMEDAAVGRGRAAAAEAAAEVRSAWSVLAEAHDEVVALRGDLLPAAGQAAAAAERAYREGLFSFTDVIAVRATAQDLRVRELDALSRYHTAAARLERLVGGPLDMPAPRQKEQQP